MNYSKFPFVWGLHSFTGYTWLTLTLVSAFTCCATLPPIKPCPSSTSAISASRYAQRQPPRGVEPVVVRAALIQANNHLFDGRRSCDHAAQVVFSLDSAISEEDILKLGPKLYRLKGTYPADPEERGIAQNITNEQYRPDSFMKVPISLGGSESIYMAHVWIERSALSANYIKPRSLLIFYVYIEGGVPYTTRFLNDK